MLSLSSLLPVVLLLASSFPSALAINSTISSVDLTSRHWNTGGNCDSSTEWWSPRGNCCVRYPSLPPKNSSPPSPPRGGPPKPAGPGDGPKPPGGGPAGPGGPPSPPSDGPSPNPGPAPPHLPDAPAPPSTKGCPHGWSWQGSYCVPWGPSDADNSSPTCRITGHTWCSVTYACTTDTFPSSGGDDCSPHTQFWWTRSNGGGYCCTKSPPSPPKVEPPKGSSCPSNGWFWHSEQSCCIPKTPNDCSTPKPTCETPGHVWNADTRCCKGPTASGGHRKREQAARKAARAFLVPTMPLGKADPARCSNGLTACPVNGAATGPDAAYECLDPLYELESCGGCKSMGQGTDCTALVGAKSVGCEVGTCKVYSCSAGYAIATDGKTCVRTRGNGATASLFAQTKRSRSVRARR